MSTFGWQQGASRSADRLIGLHEFKTGWEESSLSKMKDASRRMGENSIKWTSQGAQIHLQSPWMSHLTQPYTSEGALGSITRTGARGLSLIEKPTLAFANSLNKHLLKQGKGVAGGFQSLGAVMSRVPLKTLAKSYAIGTPFMIAVETMGMGKPMNFQTVAEAAWHNIPFTIGMEMAGGGLKGIGKHMGYMMVGEYAGLGPWGSLGLQIAGSTFAPGLGIALGAAAVGHAVGTGAYDLQKKMYQLGKGVRKTEFETGDLSFATAEAATMRQRAVGAIQKSHLNMRSMLGREATIMMGR